MYFSSDALVTTEIIAYALAITCILGFLNISDWYIDCDLLPWYADLFEFSISCRYEDGVVVCLLCLTDSLERWRVGCMKN